MKRFLLACLIPCFVTTVAFADSTNSSPSTASAVPMTSALVTAEPIAPPPDLAQRIDAYLAAYLADHQLSGNLLLARGDSILYERSFGTKSCGDGGKITPQTPFDVASITKDMTKVVAIDLMVSGMILPQTKISKYLPEFPQGDRITFMDVLRHRAGFPHRVTTAEQELVPHSSADMVALLADRVRRDGLLFEPGSESRYSSAGYTLAARLCELASGRPFATLLDSLVFTPAKMTGAFDPTPGVPLPDHAESCLNGWPGTRPALPKDYTFLEGAGSVFATARDLYHFLVAVVDTVYGEGARASLLRDGEIESYGLTNGFEAFADYHASDDLYLVYTANINTGAAGCLRRDLPRLARGERIVTPPRPHVTRVPLPEDAEQRYCGPWTSTQGKDFAITVVDGFLAANDWTLVPESETTFFSPQDYATVTFDMKGDRAVKIHWQNSQGELVWTRAGE